MLDGVETCASVNQTQALAEQHFRYLFQLNPHINLSGERYDTH